MLKFQLSLKKDALAFLISIKIFCLKGLAECGQSPNVAGEQVQTAIFTRVVGGVDAAEGAWPWQAIVLNEEIDVFSASRILIVHNWKVACLKICEVENPKCQQNVSFSLMLTITKIAFIINFS